ncbi:MAG: tetratricopeptide repeat protein [Planctomycetota bacterium]|jgi:tetratricopeptide (TPR) repeat protein
MRRVSLLLGLLLFLASPSLVSGGESFPAEAFGGKVEVHPDGSVTFAYDFEDPKELLDWDGVSMGDADAGEAWVKDGVLEVRRTSKDFAFAYLKMKFVGDIHIQLRGRLNAPYTKELLVRLYGPGSKKGYRVAMAYPMGGSMGSYIWKFPGEVLKKVKKPTLHSGSWYDIQVGVTERNITLSLRNSNILRVSDDAYRDGRIGFGTFASHVSFDSIRVQGTVDAGWLAQFAAKRVAQSTQAALTVAGEEDLLKDLSDQGREGMEKGKKRFASGDFAGAVNAFKAVWEEARTNPLPLYYQGRALMAQKLFSEAEGVFGRAVAIRDDLPWIHLWRSRARRGGGESDEILGQAVEDLRLAIYADGRYAEAFRELAQVLFLRKNFDGALAAAQKATRLLDVLRKEASGEEAQSLGEAHRAAEQARDRMAWARDGLPLSPLHREVSPLGEVRSDASKDDAQALARWIASIANGIKMVTGQDGVREGSIYLVTKKTMVETYRFPDCTIVEGEAGTANLLTGDIVLFHGAGRAGWLPASAGLAAQLMARRCQASPWIEEGLGLYFQAMPSEGADRLKPGLPHRSAASRAKTAVTSGQYTPLWKFVLRSRQEFDGKKELHRAQAWSLVHFLCHNPQVERGYFAGVFRRLAEGKRGREALGDLDWGKLEEAWKAHVQGLPD